MIVADGIDPNTAKKAAQVQRQKELKEQAQELETKRIANLTVNELFEAWLLDGVARQDNNAELRRLFTKDVLPLIGEEILSNLNEQKIRTLLRKMLKRGGTRLVVVAYNDINQMLTWAEKRQPWRGY